MVYLLTQRIVRGWECDLVSRLPTQHAWNPGPPSAAPFKLGTSVILALGRWRQAGQKLKVITGYIMTLRLSLATWDSISNSETNPNPIQPKHSVKCYFQLRSEKTVLYHCVPWKCAKKPDTVPPQAIIKWFWAHRVSRIVRLGREERQRNGYRTWGRTERNYSGDRASMLRDRQVSLLTTLQMN